MKQLTVVKIGGSLIDFEGTDIPLLVQQLRATHTQDERGPLLVVSAPKGVTNYLLKVGEQAAKSEEYDIRFTTVGNTVIRVEAVTTSMTESYMNIEKE